jgi:hypothetical protein
MCFESSDADDMIRLRRLFPGVGESELHEIRDALHGYLCALWRIHERLRKERPEIFDSNGHPS